MPCAEARTTGKRCSELLVRLRAKVGAWHLRDDKASVREAEEDAGFHIWQLRVAPEAAEQHAELAAGARDQEVRAALPKVYTKTLTLIILTS